MYCESCGEKLQAGSRHCEGCGSYITAPSAPMAGSRLATLPPLRLPDSQYWDPAAVSGGAQEREPLTMGQYLLIFLLLCLPLVNIVLLLKWSFWPGGNINRRNFARASLVVILIMAVFYVMLGRAMAGY